ncbi:MAG: recombinase family protein [Bdellovibrio sp.]
MNRIGIYLRVSTEEQAKILEGSLVSQRRRAEEYVDGQNRREPNWGSIIDIYCDEAKSGKDMNRPEFQRLLEDIRVGRINLVLASELSRLSRSIKDFCGLLDFFKEHKVKLVTLREQFDTTTAAGELMMFNLVNFNQFERKQTGERITANFTSRAERGLWNGGVIPLGYKRNPENPGSLLVDDTDSETIKMIFKIFLQIKNLRQTCLKLNELGIRTKSYINGKGESKGGNKFTVASLHHLLTNATFIGMREINKKRGDIRQVKASWKSIIDENDFKAVQKILESNRRRFKPDEWKTYPYPLTGKVICGECGKLLNGKSAHGKTQKHYYYDHARTLNMKGVAKHKCQVQRVRAVKFEDLVLSSLKQILMRPGPITKAIEAYETANNNELPLIESRLKTISDDIKVNEKKSQNLIQRIEELPSELSAELFYKRLTEINKKTQELKAAQIELESQKRKSTQSSVSESSLRTRVEYAIKHLSDAPKEKHREVFDNVIQFAEIHPTKLRLGIYGGYSNLKGSEILSIVDSHTIKNGGEREIRTLVRD